MWNRLGVVHMLLGKYDAAELVLNQVLAIAPKSAAAYAQASNNLGVLAEVRGDPKRASSFYAAALPASAPEERSLVEANLNRIRSER